MHKKIYHFYVKALLDCHNKLNIPLNRYTSTCTFHINKKGEEILGWKYVNK